MRRRARALRRATRIAAVAALLLACAPPLAAAGGEDRSETAVAAAAPEFHLGAVPRTARVGRRTRFALTAFYLVGAQRVPVGGATIKFAGRTLTTDARGIARTVVTFAHARSAQAIATTPAGVTGSIWVEVLRRFPQFGGGEPGERPCYSGRVLVKNLADRRVGLVDPHPIPISLTALWFHRRPPRLSFHTPRIPGIEHHVFAMQVRLVAIQLEPDFDIHLVVAEPGHPRRTMITEFPSPICSTVVTSPYRRPMTSARAALRRACGPARRRQRRIVGSATIVGVGFWDTRHGQFGIARNGVELHPVLGLSSGYCRSARPVRHRPRRRR